MNTKITKIAESTVSQQEERSKTHFLTRQRFLLLEGGGAFSLAVAALVPRIILANQLDIVTDEVVYISGGKLYLPLIKHFSINAPGWTFNYEHPPLVKLFIGLSVYINSRLGYPLGELFAARLPSIISGIALVMILYLLGRAPFGRVVAFSGALCLAFSPWLTYFSALAYLDMTMTTFITLAYLLLWHALRHPWLYLVLALLIGCGTASKYTALLIIPAIILFTAYYFLAIRPRIPAAERPDIPWLWWLGAIALAPLTFLLADPAIWPHPLSRLTHSILFEWNHAKDGHLTFIAGQYGLHVPQWAVLYIVAVKFSAFVTIPAAFFTLFATIQLLRFHLHIHTVPTKDATSLSFLLIWLLSTLGAFSLLNIVVGTHYDLPLAPPVALAGACGLAVLLRYSRKLIFSPTTPRHDPGTTVATTGRTRMNPHTAFTVALLLVAMAGSHFYGLITVHAAEGYTSEFFQSENATLQVAYPDYRDALQWIIEHSRAQVRIGLIAAPNTLNASGTPVSWYSYNKDLPTRLILTEAHPDDSSFPYDYLVWPMHLVQRGYAIPEPWRSHVIHIVLGGNTIYAYILQSSSAAGSS